MGTDILSHVGAGPRHLAFDLPTPVIKGSPQVSIEVLPQATVATLEGLVKRAEGLAINDPATYQIGQGLLVEIHKADKALDARKKDLLAPIKQITTAVGEIITKVSEPLQAAKAELLKAVNVFERAERQRVEAEARAKDEALRQEREAAAAKAKVEADAARAQAEQEAAELAEVLGTAPVPVPEVVVPEPEIIRSTAVVMPAHLQAPSATTTRKEKKVVIDDPRAVAAAYEIGGEVLVKIESTTVRRLLLAGKDVPGARLVEEENVVMKPVR